VTIAGPIWLVGCGNMGGAMLRGWVAADIDPARVTVIDPARPDVPGGVRLLDAPPAGEPPPALAVLAVKPQLAGAAAETLAPRVGADTLLVSILAGIETATLRTLITAPQTIVRAMPNLPASIGQGVTVLFAEGLGERERCGVADLMAPLGQVEWIDDEGLFHAVTALSGSGPAFVLRFAEALAAGGVALGLSQGQAQTLALSTIRGTAALAASASESPAQLVERVRSPNGTTHAGLEMLDVSRFAEIVAETLAAAARRSRELGTGG
jgi:pyrroline-5-carboxylate reductase